MSTPATPLTHGIGPYRLVGRIGEGGMGVVYLAEATDGRHVAMKVLRPYVVGDAHGRARLAREVTSLRRVRSPRIAEVYDADPWGDTPYIVTRYVAGPSLREAVDSRGVLSGADLVRVARGLAEALAVVHRADVLHRDIKPSNVLLENGEPVLIDFGLAQLSDDVTLTQAGWLLGTPGYLAPEILDGESPTPAADVHAWAATVVFAALGRGPYGNGPSMAILDRVRRSALDLEGVPPQLVPILTAALRQDRANRPTARQVVEWLDARPVAAPTRSRAPARALEANPLDYQLPGLPGATAFQPSGDLPPASRPFHSSSDRLRRVAFWLAVLCLVVAGTVAAPLVTTGCVLVLGWGLRTLALAAGSVQAWQAVRGPRRRDTTLCLLSIPWFAVRRLGASLVNALCVVGCAGGLVAAAWFGPASVETPALAIAGLVSGLVSWGGPLTGDVRRGAEQASLSLPRSGPANVVLVLLILGVACGLDAVQQVTGSTYLPLSGR